MLNNIALKNAIGVFIAQHLMHIFCKQIHSFVGMYMNFRIDYAYIQVS